MGRKRCTKEYTVINLNPRNVSEEERRRIILSLPKSVLKPAPPGYKPTKVYKELTEEELNSPKVPESVRKFLKEHPEYYAAY